MGRSVFSAAVTEIAATIAIGALVACGPNLPAAPTSRFHNQGAPDNSLRVGEVYAVGTVKEFQAVKPVPLDTYLTAAGVPADTIHDGSVVMVRIFCCNGPNESGTALFVYVPPGMTASKGDIIEFWTGKMIREGEPPGPAPNTMVRTVQSANAATKPCRWLPDDPNMWDRTIYCDWMPADGWAQQSGIYDIWLKTGAPQPALIDPPQ
jgi:hypothetical protein